MSVPSYTIHRDPEVWGPDIEVYRPERWFECDHAAIQKTFNPFSVGPRLVAIFFRCLLGLILFSSVQGLCWKELGINGVAYHRSIYYAPL